MARTHKTNATRLLDRRGVAYEPRTYDETLTTAAGVASALQVPPSRVYKTLVMLGDETRLLLVMVPGDAEVELKLLAREIGARRVRMAPKKDAERLTGLQTGGIGALALTGRPFEVYIDRRALREDSIFVNGGCRGLNVRLAVQDLLEVTGARAVDSF
jgi:Cys-tRNA(Pro)/Cys-tRNA(Cys) deacylase